MLVVRCCVPQRALRACSLKGGPFTQARWTLFAAWRAPLAPLCTSAWGRNARASVRALCVTSAATAAAVLTPDRWAHDAQDRAAMDLSLRLLNAHVGASQAALC
jgi:hypothetical protein